MKIIHFGIHERANNNAGDTLLFQLTRDLYDHFFGLNEWILADLWKEVTEQDLIDINDCDLVLIGGGGLLLRDQVGASNTKTGWQWNCPNFILEKIKVPIVVFGIGYNKFRGQEPFSEDFDESINLLIEKSAFFGVRNHGSIRRLASHLFDPSLSRKICFQPCPTTLIWNLLPEDFSRHNYQTKKLAINYASDREHLRFGDSKSEVLEALLKLATYANKSGWSTCVVAHKDGDVEFFKLAQKGLEDITLANLSKVDSSKVIKFYKSTDMIVGMRGHSQLIPFGMRKPILSVISHDKLRFLLEDINCLDWGVDIKSKNLSSDLIQTFDQITKSNNSVAKRLATNQSKFWDISLENLRGIRESLNDY